MSTIVKNFKAISYMGSFESEIGDYKINGSLNTDGDKIIQNFSGSVTKNDVPVANFNAYWSGESLRYNFNDIADLNLLPSISAAVAQSYEEVNTEIHEN